jgi:hypothetical protein
MENIIPQRDTALPLPPQRGITCHLCWQRPGLPCTVSQPNGDHLARYITAVRMELMSAAELAALVGGLTVIDDHAIIVERRACWYCDRTGLPLEPCCGHHQGELVCADRAECKDFMLGQLAETRQA